MADPVLVRTCIECPRGCRLVISRQGAEVGVSGNGCPRGEEHGIREAVCPRRVLTTTVRTIFPRRPVLPVRSRSEVPLSDIPRLMRLIGTLCVDRPLGCGEVVARDLLSSGVDLIATDGADDA